MNNKDRFFLIVVLKTSKDADIPNAARCWTLGHLPGADPDNSTDHRDQNRAGQAAPQMGKIALAGNQAGAIV